jgi:hypothetical protein
MNNQSNLQTNLQRIKAPARLFHQINSYREAKQRQQALRQQLKDQDSVLKTIYFERKRINEQLEKTNQFIENLESKGMKYEQ